MKYLLCMILFSAGSILRAQDQYPSPEYSNYPYFFNKSTKQLVALEKTSAKITTKAKALGYGGVSSQYVIEGNASTIKIPVTDTTEFIITGGNAMMDPSQTMSLYLLDVNKRQRMAVMMQGKGVFGKNKETGKVAYLVKKKNDRYVLVVPVKLVPGEYAFINMLGNGSMDQTFDAYCFSVQ